jgi:hypothetical protein
LKASLGFEVKYSIFMILPKAEKMPLSLNLFFLRKQQASNEMLKIVMTMIEVFMLYYSCFAIITGTVFR